MHLTPLKLAAQYLTVNGCRPKNGRRPTRWPFPYNAVLPMALRDHVSGKGDKHLNAACLHEMSILFACMKKNEFAQALCHKEIESFQSCHKKFMHTQRMRKEQERQGNLLPGAKHLSHKQVNQLLKQYPQPK